MVRGHLWDLLIVDVAEKRHVWYVIIEFMIFHKVSRLFVLLTASLANIFLGCHVSILT